MILYYLERSVHIIRKVAWKRKQNPICTSGGRSNEWFLKAVAQIYPDKKIASVKRKSVIKRFNEARFAKGANRDYMESIEFTGLMLEDLIDIGLEEMCAISDELGL